MEIYVFKYLFCVDSFSVCKGYILGCPFEPNVQPLQNQQLCCIRQYWCPSKVRKYVMKITLVPWFMSFICSLNTTHKAKTSKMKTGFLLLDMF